MHLAKDTFRFEPQLSVDYIQSWAFDGLGLESASEMDFYKSYTQYNKFYS